MQKNNNVVIVGGGPSGIEASKALSKLGYTTFLIEKENKLGGHLAQWDRLFPEGISAQSVLDEMTSSMENVKWFLDSQITSVNKLENSYNIILSNGLSIIADALLITTGFDLFKAEKKEEYGYGVYNNVITNADLENYFKKGSDLRINNPKSIGFVHCVGSRDEKAGNRHCSKVCCATAVKQACEIKAKFPQADVYSFYMDLRMFGRKYEDMYLEAQRDYGIRFVRGRLSEVSEKQDGRLLVKAEDTLSAKPLRITLDLLVLMSGMVHNQDTDYIAKMLSLPVDEDGFLKSKDLFLSAQKSSKNGIFYAGACTGPKTLPESISEASAAALDIHRYLIEMNKLRHGND
jgi:heterodisulfide reductase subunit A2